MTTSASPAGCLRRSWKRIVCWSVCFSLFSLLPGSLLAATYYVSQSTGSDGNDGTSAPWKTLGKVTGTGFNGGDQILFKRGDSWHESLVISSPGTDTAPITFGAYGSGDPPLFDGTTGVTWTSAGGDIYTASWSGSNPGLLLYKGEAKPSITTLQFGSVPAALKKDAILLQTDNYYSNLWVTSTSGNTVSGITFFAISSSKNVYVRQLNASGTEEAWSSSLGYPTIITSPAGLTEPGHWYWDGTDVYLYSDVDPNTIDVKIGQRATGITVTGDYLNIQDIAVKGYQDAGILLSGTQGVVVQNMQVADIGAVLHHNNTGILLMNATGNTVKNNRVESALRVGIGIYATGSTNSHGNTVSGNTVSNTGATGISLNTDTAADAALIQNNIIDGNTVIGANALAYDSAGIYLLNIGVGNVLKNNTIRGGGNKYLRSAGIMADGGTAPLEISYNTIFGNSLAGIAVTGTGHNIHNNVIQENGVPSWESAQIVFFPVSENASACTVNDNTLAAGGNRKLLLVLRNPAFTSSEGLHLIDNNTYSSVDTNTFCWSKDETCDGWVDFSSWKNISGQDGNSSFSLIPLPPPPQVPPVKTITGVYHLLL